MEPKTAGIMLLFLAMFATIGWTVYLAADMSKRQRRMKVQAELHGRLLDKFSSAHEPRRVGPRHRSSREPLQSAYSHSARPRRAGVRQRGAHRLGSRRPAARIRRGDALHAALHAVASANRVPPRRRFVQVDQLRTSVDRSEERRAGAQRS